MKKVIGIILVVTLYVTISFVGSEQKAAPQPDQTDVVVETVPPLAKVALSQNKPEPMKPKIDVLVAELTELEQRILKVALTCRNAKPEHKDENLLTDLLLMERHFGVPNDLRGMLLASACTESGYNPNAEGDHKFSKKGKPKAIGLLQLWYWWTLPVERGGYAVDRRDPRANAFAWMSHIKKQYPKVRKKCKISRKHVSRIWRVAWVTAIRAPKPEGRCNEFPTHYHRLKKWKRQWANLL